jgi:hypothetical protein
VKVLQTLLGHKTVTLTLDRYGHLFPDDLGRIAAPSILPLKLLRTLCGRFRHCRQSRPAKPFRTWGSPCPHSDSNRHWTDFNNGHPARPQGGAASRIRSRYLVCTPNAPEPEPYKRRTVSVRQTYQNRSCSWNFS